MLMAGSSRQLLETLRRDRRTRTKPIDPQMPRTRASAVWKRRWREHTTEIGGRCHAPICTQGIVRPCAPRYRDVEIEAAAAEAERGPGIVGDQPPAPDDLPVAQRFRPLPG